MLVELHEVIGHGSGKLSERVSVGAQSYLKEYFSTLEEGAGGPDGAVERVGSEAEGARADYGSGGSGEGDVRYAALGGADATAADSEWRHD